MEERDRKAFFPLGAPISKYGCRNFLITHCKSAFEIKLNEKSAQPAINMKGYDHKIRHIQMFHVFYVSHAVLLIWLKEETEETGDALRIALQVHEGNHQLDANTCQRYW
jgi:hypothetical protein